MGRLPHGVGRVEQRHFAGLSVVTGLPAGWQQHLTHHPERHRSTCAIHPRCGRYLCLSADRDGLLGNASSDVVTVRVSQRNAPPVANAGGNRTALVGETVVLDGGGSTDANPGDVLRYAWQLVSSPTTTPASTAKLSPASNPAGTASTNKTVSITPDQPGTYVVALVVNDGTDSSDTALVTITVRAVNQAPVAVITGAAGTTVSAGTATGTVGTVMTFDGRSSTDDGPAQLLTYRWRLSSSLQPAHCRSPSQTWRSSPCGLISPVSMSFDCKWMMAVSGAPMFRW